VKIGHRKLIKIIREELNYALLREATEDLNKKWKDFRFRVLPGDIGNEIISYKEWRKIVKLINEEDSYLAGRLLLDSSVPIESLVKKFKTQWEGEYDSLTDLHHEMSLRVWRGDLAAARWIAGDNPEILDDFCDPNEDPMACVDYVLWILSMTHGQNSPHFDKLADFAIRVSPESFESDPDF
jgi:hypothetical protein